MTQNIYDDAGFFQNYSQLPRSLRGLDGAPEWPALRALLPALGASSVLDLGCGFGWFCRFAAGQGAAEVLGVDVSERMLARARAETSAAAVRYELADLERYEPPFGRFDLVYSSLALHYLVELPVLFARVQRALRPGGRFVFSVEPPIMTALRHQGWTSDASGLPVWPVGGYRRGQAGHRLAGRGRSQAAPDAGELSQPADRIGFRAAPDRGMGSDARADRGRAGLGEGA